MMFLRTVFIITLATCFLPSEGQILQEKLTNISGDELSAILKIDIRNKLNESYSGYYEYAMDDDNKKVLNGNFMFAYHHSGTREDIKYSTRIEYSGKFTEGSKDGSFIENLLRDDGVDLYSKWVIELNFSGNQCTNGTFEGLMGHAMPTKKYSFSQLTQCTFQEVVQLAGDMWQDEWERNNKN